MKVLVFGGNGQLGLCLQDVCSSEEELAKIIPENTDLKLDYVFTDREQIDIVNDDIYDLLQEIAPNVVINCAAYTDVAGAEDNPKDAFLVNTYAVSKIAEACAKLGIKFFHISTDFVFDGNKNTPYEETDFCKPLNVYGLTKFYGEQYIEKVCPESVIIRTSWLYSKYGNNFVKRVIGKLEEKQTMSFAYDEIGCPTSAMNLARFIMLVAIKDFLCPDPFYRIKGIIHFTDSGVASRYDFAREIEELFSGFSIGDKSLIYPCVNFEDKRVKRPKYSVLSNERARALAREYTPVHWRTALWECIVDLGRVVGE